MLYDDGPINGTTDAWTINFGYIVSNTFTLLNNSTVSGFDFGVWEFPGDTLTSVDWSFTAMENGGTLYASGTASGKNSTDQFISTNQFGYDIDEIHVQGLNVSAQRSLAASDKHPHGCLLLRISPVAAARKVVQRGVRPTVA